jgi:hypothetical protein
MLWLDSEYTYPSGITHHEISDGLHSMSARSLKAVKSDWTRYARFVPNDDFASPRVNVRFREYLEGD